MTTPALERAYEEAARLAARINYHSLGKTTGEEVYVEECWPFFLDSTKPIITAFLSSLAKDASPMKLMGREPTEAMLEATSCIIPPLSPTTFRAAWDAAPVEGENGGT